MRNALTDSHRRSEVRPADASLAAADPCASDGTGALPAEPATVDVVIVAYNSRDTLRMCVEPLVRVPWVDVTVVDNACPENSAGVVADLPVRIVRSPRNGGFAYGCNVGSANGSADFVLFLNPDAEINAASLAVLVDALRADTTLAGVGPLTVDAAGDVIFTQRRFPRLRFTYAQGLFLHRVAPGAAWADDQIRDLGGVRAVRESGMDLRLLHAPASRGDRIRGRARRTLLPLLRGNRFVQTVGQRGMASWFRTPRDGTAHRLPVC